MLNEKYKEAMQKISPDKELIERTKATMRAEIMSEDTPVPRLVANKRPARRKIATFVATAAILAFAVLGINFFNQTGDILPNNPFVIRASAMERLPDGTYVRREADFTQLYGWGGHYDGEFLYIGLGLWFEFEGEGIREVEFSLQDGFFATQYIGNRGERENVPRAHITVPGYTTSRLVMYGYDFDKIGDSITFGNAMDEDILLFWASDDLTLDDWYRSDQVIKIDVTVTFEDGVMHTQKLVLELFGTMGWISIAEGVIPHDPDFKWFTEETQAFILSAPIEYFTYLPGAVREVSTEEMGREPFDPNVRIVEFYIGGHQPHLNWIHPFDFEAIGTNRLLIGVRDGMGYMLVVEHEGAIITGIRAYSIQLY